MFGSFVRDSDKRIVYTGTRSDKPSLERGHTFVEGIERPSVEGGFDDYKYENRAIIKIKDAFKRTSREVAQVVHDKDDPSHHFYLDKILELERRIAKIEGKSKPDSSKL